MLGRTMLTRATSALGAALMVAGLAAAPAQAAEALPTGSVVVGVTHWADGSVATGGCVEAFDAAGTSVGSDCVGEAGTYTVGGLADGDYRLKLSGFGTAPTQYYDRASTLASATAVTVADGGAADISYALLAKSTISGTVRDTDGAPMAGVTVTMRDAAADGDLARGASVETGADGRYVLTIAANTSQLVSFEKTGFGASSWPSAPLSQGGTFYGPSAPFRTRADMVLAPAGAIEGTIAAPPGLIATGAQACVLVYDYASDGPPLAKGCGLLGERFRFDDLRGGVDAVRGGGYVLCVAPYPATRGCTSDTGWFGGPASSPLAAKRIDVEAGSTTAVALAWGGTLKIAVTLDNGAPLSRGCLVPQDGLPALGLTTNCAPVGGVFTVTATKDFWLNPGAFDLRDALNTRDRSLWMPQTRVQAGGTTVIPITVPALGKASATVAVKRADGNAITKGCVYAVLHGPAKKDRGQDCTIAADGVASFTGLPDGTYSFEVRDVPGSYATVAYPAVVNAPGSRITLSGTQHVRLAMKLPTTQTVRGHVLGPDGAPVAGATVVRANKSGVLSTATTASDGSYQMVAPVVASSIGVIAADSYGQAWYASSASFSGATTVTGRAKARTISDVDIALEPGQRITGTIAVPDTMAAASACVMALDPAAAIELARDCGDVGDPFELDGLATGAYRICVAPAPATDGCWGEKLPGAIVSRGGSPVTSTIGAEDLAMNLAFGGTVLATARRFDGTVVMDGCADLLDGKAVAATTCDNVDGVFTLSVGHDLGQYPEVRVRGAEALQAARQSVAGVGAGRTENVRVSMEDAPSLRGTIIRPAGLEGLTVCAQVTDGAGFEREQCLEPGVSKYSIQVHEHTSYYVQFYSEGAGAAFQWYDGAGRRAKAKPVEVPTYDVTLPPATLKVEATISGVITTSAGAPASGAKAVVVDIDGRAVQAAVAGEDGAYTVDSLPAGTYTVRFLGSPGQASLWYGGTLTSAGAKTITVAAGGTGHASGRLRPAGTIRVSVTAKSGEAVAGCLEAYTSRLDYVGRYCDTVDGAYALDDLLPGTYVVRAVGFDGLGDRWYPSAVGVSDAKRLTVRTGETVAARMVLGKGGTIAGRVSAPLFERDGTPIRLYTLAGQLVDSTTADVSGNYSFDHVPAGSFRVYIDPAGHLGGWVRARTAISPRTLTFPTASGSWSITGADRTLGRTEHEGVFVGSLNVPLDFTSKTVCAVAINKWKSARGAICGPQGAPFALEVPDRDSVRVVMTDGVVTTPAQWNAFTGRRIWVGGASTYRSSPAFDGLYATEAYIPVYFFTDVTYASPAWFEISWIADAGIATGFGDGSFRPQATVTRGQMAQYLYRLAGEPDVRLPKASPFTDVAATSPIYRAALWLRQEGIVTTRAYRPGDAVTRGATADLLYRLADKPAYTPPSKSPFKDVKTTSSTYKAITWAASKGIAMGDPDGTYKPNASLTRVRMAQSVYRWAAKYGG
ncbi:carboxypeptidase regulatory-like domain-containing protein [Demequina silvatica]|uniref:carboxypeptidase regulatory-like domain-containing protein n=1 Tax=Demequina silvatica TaxID=1638988 RepID=UPI0007862C9F|nr:carboxypeptidase regulatory-like domain-containing protein [Demequina silvatica]